jgi:MFS family permease
MGLDFLPTGVVAALICIGTVCSVAYVIHAKRTPVPILDLSLLKLPTFRASIFGGFMFRMGIGALPFLLPLLLQIGFDLTPFQSGMITFTGALGSMFMKAAIARVLKRFGYRSVLVYNSLISAAFLAACATFVPGMPFAVMVVVLLTGGFFRSLQFTSINTIAYAEIDPARMSRATALVAAAQQLSLSTGVAVGALVVEITLRLKHGTTMGASDFPPAFLAIGALSASAALMFINLAPDAGEELSGRKTLAPIAAVNASNTPSE